MVIDTNGVFAAISAVDIMRVRTLIELGRQIKRDPLSAEAVLAKAHIRMSFPPSNATTVRQPP